MESSSLEEENTIKGTWTLFRLENELNYAAMKYIRHLFSLEKEIKAIKNRILRDIKNFFEY